MCLVKLQVHLVEEPRWSFVVAGLEGGRDGKLDNAGRDPTKWLKNIKAAETSNGEVTGGGFSRKVVFIPSSSSWFNFREEEVEKLPTI
ncbi:hypothetical protein U1Q18_011279 [Sarracenia purpurea var. burkii]